MRPKVATYHIVRRSLSLTRRCSPPRDELPSVAKPVSGAPHGLDQLDWIIVVDLPSQPAHKHLEHIRKWIVVLVPDVRGYRCPVYDLSPVENKKFEQRKFLRRQFDRPAVAAHSLAIEVYFEVSDAHRLGEGSATAATESADTSQQLAKREGLGEVIVGAYFETCDAVIDGVARREHEYRGADVLAPQVAAQVETAPAREHYIENENIEAAQSRLHLSFGVRRNSQDLNAMFGQPGFHYRCEAGVVFDQKNFHEWEFTSIEAVWFHAPA
jgi:hypothetical protein